MNELHFMLDCETLSTKCNAALLDIACIQFDLNGKHTEDDTSAKTFHARVDMRDCAAKNLDIDGETVRWWLSQDLELMKATLIPAFTADTDVLSLTNALLGLTKFIEGVISESGLRYCKLNLWANGPAQDCTWIRNAYNACHLPCPVPFYGDRDLRTIMQLGSLKSGRRLHEEIKFSGQKHNSIADVKHQIKQAQLAWSILK